MVARQRESDGPAVAAINCPAATASQRTGWLERSLLGLARLRVLHGWPHPQLLGQRPDLVVGVAAVTSEGPQEGELAFLGPPRDRLGRHVKQAGYL
jgi:hypothetical protein